MSTAASPIDWNHGDILHIYGELSLIDLDDARAMLPMDEQKMITQDIGKWASMPYEPAQGLAPLTTCAVAWAAYIRVRIDQLHLVDV